MSYHEPFHRDVQDPSGFWEDSATEYLTTSEDDSDIDYMLSSGELHVPPTTSERRASLGGNSVGLAINEGEEEGLLAATSGPHSQPLSIAPDPSQSDFSWWTWVNCGYVRSPLIRTVKVIPLLVAIWLTTIAYFIPVFETRNAEHNCFVLLVLVSVLWATEAVPLFVTSILIPIPVVWFNILLDPLNCADINDPATCNPLPAPEAAPLITGKFFDPSIMLFLGGFTIAAALGKYKLSNKLARYVLAMAGTDPKWVLLAMMILSWFLSMWISNVAAALLSTAVILPTLRDLPASSSFSKAALLGISMSCNLGGMTTPIASPQNAIALSALPRGESISFLAWMAGSIPVTVIGLVGIWIGLHLGYRSRYIVTEIKKQEYIAERLRGKHYFILAVTVVTVGLWATDQLTESFTGNIGITAIIPVVMFFGSGLLSTKEFDSLAWNILVLMGGGLALGEAISSSGLLQTIASDIQQLLDGQSTWVILLTFNTLVGVVGMFISSTVAAAIILPVVAAVGLSPEINASKLLVVGGAYMCSAAMGLPVSSFPNANAYSVEDGDGQKMLTPVDFVITGVPACLWILFLLQSVNYGVGIALGFA
eukprot:CAMPEP_0174238334 /NCGR_PEP_ID=MMETSP0417-20130205/11013_1 /TAXON_ID=242541 /ORGANISM="Mayorella sp, Strain BSH-02190019" /LENGTH=593 /DNA_ID=CAMNT_0015317159 /DNA_START=81 /DNA_END=1858 /DNA_ORIENTATION=+